MNDEQRELGEILKNARLKMGYCLKSLESKTSIRQSYLEAMEAGNFKFLSHIYINGFVQKVVETVELDMGAIRQSYPEIFQKPIHELEPEFGLAGIDHRARLSFIEAHAFFALKIVGSLCFFYLAFYVLKKFFSL
jgi:hypothetical protein